MAVKKISSTNWISSRVAQLNSLPSLSLSLPTFYWCTLRLFVCLCLCHQTSFDSFLPQVVASHSGPARSSHSPPSAAFQKTLPLHFIFLCPTFYFPQTAEAVNLCAANEIFRKLPSHLPHRFRKVFLTFAYTANAHVSKKSIPLISTRHLLRSISWLPEQSETLYYMLPPTFAFQMQRS